MALPVFPSSRSGSRPRPSALRQVVTPSSVFDFIYWYVREVALLTFRSPGPPLRQIDLAAGMAIRYELGDRLAQLTKLCQETWFDDLTSAVTLNQSSRKQPDVDAASLALKARCRRWNSAELNDEKWRQMRWGSAYPLRWDGRKYDS